MFDILNAGETFLRDKAGSFETATIDQFVFANITGVDASTVVDKDQSMPEVGDIVHTTNISKSGKVDADKVVFSTVLDVSVGDFTFNWVGIRSSVSDVLIAVATVDPTIKRKEIVNVQTGNNITRSYLIYFANAANITEVSIPAESWQLDFSGYLTEVDERARLINQTVFGDLFVKEDSFSLINLGSGSYQVKKGEGVFKGFHYELLANEAFTVPSLVPPFKVWLDISIQGDSQSKEVVAGFVYNQTEQVDHVTNEIQHYLFELGGVDGSGDVYDSIQSNRHKFSYWEAVHQETENRFHHSEEQGAALHQICGNYVDIRINNTEGSNQSLSVLFAEKGLNVQDTDEVTVSFDYEVIDGVQTGTMSSGVLEGDVTNDTASIVWVGNRGYATKSVSSAFDISVRPFIWFSNVTNGSDFTVRLTNIQIAKDATFEYSPSKNLLENPSLLGGSENTFPSGWSVHYGVIGSVVGYGLNPEPVRYWGESLGNIYDTGKECVLVKNRTFNKVQFEFHNELPYDRTASIAFHPQSYRIDVSDIKDVVFSMYLKVLSGTPYTAAQAFSIVMFERDILDNQIAAVTFPISYYGGGYIYMPYTLVHPETTHLWVSFRMNVQPADTQFTFEMGDPILSEGNYIGLNPLNNRISKPRLEDAEVGTLALNDWYVTQTDDLLDLTHVTEVVQEQLQYVPVKREKALILNKPNYPQMVYRNEYPEVLRDDYTLQANMTGTELIISGGQFFLYRGVETIHTSGYTDAERTLDFSGELTTKDFHVRWNREDGFYYIDELDATYNPTAAGWYEGDYCDTTIEDMFIGRVAWDGTDWVLMYTPQNKRVFESVTHHEEVISFWVGVDSYVVSTVGNVSLNWSRIPKYQICINQLTSRGDAADGSTGTHLEQIVLVPYEVFRTDFRVRYKFEDSNQNQGWLGYTTRLFA